MSDHVTIRMDDGDIIEAVALWTRGDPRLHDIRFGGLQPGEVPFVEIVVEQSLADEVLGKLRSAPAAPA